MAGTKKTKGGEGTGSGGAKGPKKGKQKVNVSSTKKIGVKGGTGSGGARGPG